MPHERRRAHTGVYDRELTNNGGKVIIEEHPVPGIGTFSVVTDNVGATICLFQGLGAA